MKPIRKLLFFNTQHKIQGNQHFYESLNSPPIASFFGKTVYFIKVGTLLTFFLFNLSVHQMLSQHSMFGSSSCPLQPRITLATSNLHPLNVLVVLIQITFQDPSEGSAAQELMNFKCWLSKAMTSECQRHYSEDRGVEQYQHL